MKDFKLLPMYQEGVLIGYDIDPSGATVEGAEAVLQKVGIRLRTFKNEDVLRVGEEDNGIPYIELKAGPRVLLESYLRQVIQDTPEVDSIDSFELVEDSANRKLSLSVSVGTKYGKVEDEVSFADFY